MIERCVCMIPWDGGFTIVQTTYPFSLDVH